ncbi:MAG TPA: NADH-quinone oxidoreductase subunit NuoG [Actinomycetota bacterium]|nr:NADH-quinone oxidoreductase subunit NuoG [Actinomycetota bacterium]
MPPDPVTIKLNGTEVVSDPGRMLIDVAEGLGIFIPRFCYHPGMASVAACRMCLVEIEGQRKLLPACATAVTDGMVVHTDSRPSIDAQRAVLEWLLINHPLDCPICDRGGECPLQDQALGFGPGRSQYHEPKRHFRKPLPLSDLVALDRERCVLCWRCVRFCREVSGDKEIELLDRGSLAQINRGPAEPFDSKFSGNTIQICPVGALTATPYRFLSRPWDLLTTASVCSFCSVGCPLSVERRGNEVLRAQALANDAVNHFWNCDKGRYGHRYVSHADRLTTPLVRKPAPGAEAGAPDTFEQVTWGDALEAVTEALSQTIGIYGPEAVGFIGGSHATNEDLFAATTLFRHAVGTANLDFRTFDAAFDYAAFGPGGVVGSTATINDLDSAKTILWFGPDPKEELPVLFLRLRAAALKGARLLVAHPRRISLCDFGTHLAYGPGREAELMAALTSGSRKDCGVPADVLDGAAAALGEGKVVVCSGQQFPGRRCPEALESLAAWAAALTTAGRGGLLLCGPNANSQGALDFGVFPGLAPGHQRTTAGLGTLDILRATADGRIKFLWLLGADLLTDLPDAQLAAAALSSGAYIVVSELFPTKTALSADIVLPAASFAEKEGTFTNLERRIQKVNPVVAAPGSARADWHVMMDVASRLGHRETWHSPKAIAAEIARSVPTHAGFSWDGLGEGWAPVAGPADMPPELWHASGESGPLPVNRQAVSQEPRLRLPSQSSGPLSGPDGDPVLAGAGPRPPLLPGRRMTTAWPLRWELRAVDAAANQGWIWPATTPAEPPVQPPVEPASGADQSVAQATTPPAGSLMLLCGRALYDDGAMVSRASMLRTVTPKPTVELHPEEAAGRGLEEGAQVRVRSARGEVTAALHCSTDTPRGAVWLLYDQPGLQANVLLDSTEAATYVEVSA